MKSELYKRTISSFFLISFVFIFIFLNNYIFLSFLFITVILCWIEWIRIIDKINFKRITKFVYVTTFIYTVYNVYYLF